MNPEDSSSTPVKRVRAALQRLENDDGGAVLVLGVFMAACVAGMLWYLAGIGDAIIYRQRMQEASDAAAFSAAVLHARGMNLIVLLNLIMACVLGVRVTLRAIAAGLVVAGTIVAFIPPISGFAPALFNGARAMESAVRATRNPINNTIKALAKAHHAKPHQQHHQGTGQGAGRPATGRTRRGAGRLLPGGLEVRPHRRPLRGG
jgi:hypothetical protein